MAKTIRPLALKDAQRMLDCLNDIENMKYMSIGNRSYTLENCISFINDSLLNESNKHFAVIDENDNWVGTVSLKNIDKEVKQAEFAIITASSVHGKGYAKRAVNEILEYAFLSLKLNRVYLNVISDNIAANKLYLKCGFVFEGTFRESIKIGDKIYDLKWYSILNRDYLSLYSH